MVGHQEKLKVTVLMSVYNGARWLRESIESIQKQSYPNFEFIIVDDGSQDASIEIIRSYAAADPRIRVIVKPNSGLADSLNVGIEAAQGEWIARIDADDIAMPSRLATQLDHATRDERCVVLGAALMRIDEQGRECGVTSFPVHHDQLCRLMVSRVLNPIAHSSAFIRAAAVPAVGGYRKRIRRAQDYDLWLRLSEVGALRVIDCPLVRIRAHRAQISHENGGLQQMVDSRVALASFMLRRAGFKDPVSEEATDEQFREFWHFVQHSVTMSGLPEYRSFVTNNRAKLASRSFCQGFSGVFSALRAPRFLIRFTANRIFGERLTSRIVQDWIERGIRRCAD
jgi:glycosyltransferase involved in cell wall biosynthesis